MKFPRRPICQSWRDAPRRSEDLGTNEDGSKSEDFFSLLSGGKFLDEGIILHEKIEKNVKFDVQMGMPEDMARHMCENILPTLKTWQNPTTPNRQ